jgi:hypothetical protein
MDKSAKGTPAMTLPTVTETSTPPEPVVHDPFIDDVTAGTDDAPPQPEPRRRRIWD